MENKMFCFQCQETAGCTGCGLLLLPSSWLPSLRAIEARGSRLLIMISLRDNDP